MSAGSLAEGTRLSGKRISELMRHGAIDGVKVEGQWIGTRSAVSQYLSRREHTDSQRGRTSGEG
jgi:hypothetical protein